MALQFTGRDVALARQESNGKFDLVESTTGHNKGNPVLDNTRSHAVLTTIVSRKRGTRPGSQVQEGGYYYDPQNQRGTLLWTLTQDKMSTPSLAEGFAQDGGQQLLNTKTIATFAAKAVRPAPGKLRLQISWSNPDGVRNPPVVVAV